MNGVETANENAAGTTLDSLHQTVKGGFAGMNRRLARIMRSMKTVETGLADVGEFQRRLGRVKSHSRQRLILDVLDRLNAHPTNTVNQAAHLVFRNVPGGYPTAVALMAACHRVGVDVQVGRPVK